MKLLFSVIGFVAGALLASANRRTSPKSTPVQVPVTPAPVVNKVMPGTVTGPQINFTPTERYNTSTEIPDDVVEKVQRIVKDIEKFGYYT
jgi:hypothetical protein